LSVESALVSPPRWPAWIAVGASCIQADAIHEFASSFELALSSATASAPFCIGGRRHTGRGGGDFRGLRRVVGQPAELLAWVRLARLHEPLLTELKAAGARSPTDRRQYIQHPTTSVFAPPPASPLHGKADRRVAGQDGRSSALGSSKKISASQPGEKPAFCPPPAPAQHRIHHRQGDRVRSRRLHSSRAVPWRRASSTRRALRAGRPLDEPRKIRHHRGPVWRRPPEYKKAHSQVAELERQLKT